MCSSYRKDLSSCYDAVKCTIYSWDAGTDWSACTYHTIIHFWPTITLSWPKNWLYWTMNAFWFDKPYLLNYRGAAQCLITCQYESEKGELYILAERRRVLWLRPGANLCPGVRFVPGGRVILLPTRIMAIMKLAEMAHCPRRRGAKLAAPCLGKAGGRVYNTAEMMNAVFWFLKMAGSGPGSVRIIWLICIESSCSGTIMDSFNRVQCSGVGIITKYRLCFERHKHILRERHAKSCSLQKKSSDPQMISSAREARGICCPTLALCCLGASWCKELDWQPAIDKRCLSACHPFIWLHGNYRLNAVKRGGEKKGISS